MTPPWMSEAVSFCVKCIGNVVKGSATAARATSVATLSVAGVILELMGSRFADDISTVKDSLIRRQKAEADGAEAEALKKLADAAEAANRATVHKRKDQAALIEQEAKRLQNAKTQAEIDVMRSDAESRRMQAMGEAKARLIEALSKVKQEGGAVFFDQENLKRILELPFESQDKGGD